MRTRQEAIEGLTFLLLPEGVSPKMLTQLVPAPPPKEGTSDISVAEGYCLGR